MRTLTLYKVYNASSCEHVQLLSLSHYIHSLRRTVPRKYNTSKLCCTDMATLKWTRHVDTWQILKNTHDTCVRYISNTTWLHDRSVRAI